MASSYSNPSSTSSSPSATSTPSAALALSDSERVRPRLASRAAARVLSEEHWPQLGTRAAAPPTNPARAHRRRGRSRRSAGVRLPRNSGVSQHVPRSLEESGWETAADTTSTQRTLHYTEEGSSSSASAWSEPFASSSTTPSRDITLVPNASGSGPAVAMSALTSASSSAPGVETIADTAPAERDALTSSTSSVPGVMTKAAPDLDASAPVATTVADPSAATSAPGAAPTIPSLRNHWLAQHWGIVPRPVERRPGGQQQEAFGGNGVPPVEALSRPDPLCPSREHVPPPSFGVWPCWECSVRPARMVARPCGHLAICVPCYSYWYANSNRFVCPCGSPITWLLCR